MVKLARRKITHRRYVPLVPAASRARAGIATEGAEG
jgi:hypothetical protein